MFNLRSSCAVARCSAPCKKNIITCRIQASLSCKVSMPHSFPLSLIQSQWVSIGVGCVMDTALVHIWKRVTCCIRQLYISLVGRKLETLNVDVFDVLSQWSHQTIKVCLWRQDPIRFCFSLDLSSSLKSPAGKRPALYTLTNAFKERPFVCFAHKKLQCGLHLSPAGDWPTLSELTTNCVCCLSIFLFRDGVYPNSLAIFPYADNLPETWFTPLLKELLSKTPRLIIAGQ